MSSDLPDMRPDSSLTMTRMLVKTMRCDRAVLIRLREDFDCPPDLRTIRQVRIEEALGRFPRPDLEPLRHNDSYYPGDEAEKLRTRNAAFLGLLRSAYPERFA